MTSGDNDIRESTKGTRFDSPGRSPGKRPQNNRKPQRGEIPSGRNSRSVAASHGNAFGVAHLQSILGDAMRKPTSTRGGRESFSAIDEDDRDVDGRKRLPTPWLRMPSGGGGDSASVFRRYFVRTRATPVDSRVRGNDGKLSPSLRVTKTWRVER